MPGRAEWRPGGPGAGPRPLLSRLESGQAIPYGVYDMGANAGFVNVGTDHDTAAFAVESIRRWWRWPARAYPGAGGCWSPVTRAGPTASVPGGGRPGPPNSRPRRACGHRMPLPAGTQCRCLTN